MDTNNVEKVNQFCRKWDRKEFYGQTCDRVDEGNEDCCVLSR
jgi:hypothetical protein